MIAKIEGVLKQMVISLEESKNLLAEVLDYKGEIPQVRCPLLCARFITVVKRLAFVEAPEDLYGKLFGTVVETWRVGLDFDTANANRYGKGYDRVFSVQTFLQGWSGDLKHVQKPALPAYVSFLRFHKVHTGGIAFDRAVAAFVEHVKSVMGPADVDLAGRIALAFGQDVLGPLLTHDSALALKHTEAAAALIRIVVLLDPARALGDDNKPAPMAMRWLEDHIVQSGISRLEKDRHSPEQGPGLREGPYKVLNDLWRNVEPSQRQYLQQRYSTLLPLLGGWERRESRLAAPADWWVWVSFDHAGQSWRIGGAVIDLCPFGRGFHVAFTGEVQDCEDRKNEGGGVNVAFKGVEEAHAASPSSSLDPPVTNVSVRFQLPDGSSFVCEARALRGWRYEVKMGVFNGLCGAVFVIDKPEDAAALKNHLDGLMPRPGMAPPPEKAPIPPVEPTPLASTAGTASQAPPNQPGQGQPPAPCTAGGSVQPSTGPIPGGITADTPSIGVPVAECYGEIDVLGDGQVVLTVFHAKPGAGQKPKLCDPVPLTKQEYRLLLAGIEDARNRYVSEKQEQPPDEMPFILEWKRDELVAALHDGQKKSFEELDQGERKALKSAVSRVRRLINFTAEPKCGLITEATRDGVRRTTIPIRLRKAGTPLGE